MMRALGAQDAAEMAQLHQLSFTPHWSANDMAIHCQVDQCFGIGAPLQCFVIFQTAIDQAEILTIATHPDQRNKGLARQLIQESTSVLISDGIELLFLEVAEDNAHAIRLYRGLGFEQIGKRLAYYKRENGRVAALTFRKRLDASG